MAKWTIRVETASTFRDVLPHKSTIEVSGEYHDDIERWHDVAVALVNAGREPATASETG
jgi:hypothetical protein